MNIITITFEERLTFCVNGDLINLIAFRMPEHGNIKFGVDAPRTIKVHREEIYDAIKSKEKQGEIS